MYRSVSTRLFLRRTAFQRTASFHPSSPTPRAFTTSPSIRYAYKDDQDKDTLSPRSSEYSKSGTDDAASANPDAAFNPNKTRPEQETDAAGEQNNGNPLEVSPGNPEVSKPRKSDEGGAQASPRTSASGGGSPAKSGGNKSG